MVIKSIQSSVNEDKIFKVDLDASLQNMRFRVGLYTMVYNRPQYLRQFLNSISASRLPGVLHLVLDDGSEDPEISPLIASYSHSEATIVRAYSAQTEGYSQHQSIGANIDFGLNLLADEFGCGYLCILDSDVIVRPYWLEKLLSLHQELSSSGRQVLVTGFNTGAHKVKHNYGHYRLKNSVGGASMLFTALLYQQALRSKGKTMIKWDWRYGENVHKIGGVIAVTRPSVVQHIGSAGLNSASHNIEYDVATDYYTVTEFRGFVLARFSASVGWVYFVVRLAITALKSAVKLLVRKIVRFGWM